MSLRAPGARVAAPTPTPELAAAQGLIPQMPAAPPQPIPQISTLRSDQVVPMPNAAHLGVHAEPCPRCGEKNPDGSRFCHSCGFALAPSGAARAPMPAPAMQPPAMQPPAMQPPAAQAPSPPASVVCARCRGVADPGADFCKFCGARLNASPSIPRIAAQQPPEAAAAPASLEPSPSAPSAPHAPATPHAPVIADPALPPQGPTRPLHGIGEATVRARLVRIAKDGSEGAQHPISGDVTDIGRSEGAIVLADDPYLSPRHARITVRPAGQGEAKPSLVLVDLGSVNGVFVRLRTAYPLTHGDLLLLGQQVLRFEAVTELEGARGPAMQHGVLLFGSPAPVSRARLQQRTVEGLVRDVMYLVRDEFVVGREVGDRTYPEDVFMSRRHATFRREGAGHVLQDNGSSNGTFVQVQGEHILQDGDQFRIGHHLFRVDVPAREREVMA